MQERAYVTGLLAANLVMEELGIAGYPAEILDVEPDEAHVALGKQVSRQVSGVASALGLKSPFL